jgi:DNA-binding LacI/PurR family transcriptional regulator
VGALGTVGQPWPHVRQLWRLTRRRTDPRTGETRVEVTLGISSLPPTRADAERHLRMIRNYWGIENRPHRVRDVTMGEDASQVRTDAAPQVIGGLCNVTLAPLGRSGVSNIAERLRTFAGRPAAAVDSTIYCNRCASSRCRTSGTEWAASVAERSAVTIRDVAGAVGVSVTTASRVLNGSPTVIPVSSSTAERIREAAARLGYRPNVFARALRGQRTHLLGCLFADMADPFLHPIAQAAQATARGRGYRLLIADATDRTQEVPEEIEAFDRALVDGVLILGTTIGRSFDWVEQVLARHRYVVAFGRGQGRPPVSVGVDNSQGTRLLLEHLFGLGHRSIAYVGCQRNLDMRARCDSFRAFVAQHGLPCPPAYVRDEPMFDFDHGYRAMQAVLAARPRPTAVLAANDRLAIGALRAAAEAGVPVPQGVSVVGFDDLTLAAFSRPPLTTMRQPTEAMGRIAAQLLVDMVEGRTRPEEAEDVVLQPELIIRSSTAPPGGSA